MCYKIQKRKVKKNDNDIIKFDHIGLSMVVDELKNSPNIEIRKICLENIMRKRLEATLIQSQNVYFKK